MRSVGWRNVSVRRKPAVSSPDTHISVKQIQRGVAWSHSAVLWRHQTLCTLVYTTGTLVTRRLWNSLHVWRFCGSTFCGSTFCGTFCWSVGMNEISLACIWTIVIVTEYLNTTFRKPKGFRLVVKHNFKNELNLKEKKAYKFLCERQK